MAHNYDELFALGVRVLSRRGHTREQAEDICVVAMDKAREKYNPKLGSFRNYFMIWCLGLGMNAYNQRKKEQPQIAEYRCLIQHGHGHPRPLHDECSALADECAYLSRGLSRKEKKALRAWSEGQSYREVGEVIGLTKVRAFQIVQEAIGKIREKIVVFVL